MMQMPPLFALHTACAAIYATLAALVLTRQHRPAERWFFAACAVTSAWSISLVVGLYMPVDRLIVWFEICRPACWYAFILFLYKQSLGARDQVRTIFQPLGLTALLLLSSGVLLQWAYNTSVSEFSLWLEIVTRIGFAVCGILLLENLYRNTPPESRWNINLLCVGLGGMFAYDLILYADAALFHQLSRAMVQARAPVMMLAAPVLAMATTRYRRWAFDIRLSHDVAFHSFTLIGCGVFLLAVALIGEVLRGHGSEWGSVAETALIFAAVLALSVVITSGSARARIRGLVVDNFFSHRYDYRKEWMRCIQTLTAPETFVALHKRAIRAAAEVVDSPAGALFVRSPEDLAFQWAGSWNMPPAMSPVPPGHPIVPLFRDNNWIVQLDNYANASAWFPDLPRTWIVLPLNHFGALIGFIVLARSRAHFMLDREAFDLLRVIGREIASRVAEQRAEQVLAQTRQLREYSQRFAFVIHDIKNVSGQLSMLLTNAEVHADNPEFQRDVLATVAASLGKITRLLSRLEPGRRERDGALLTPADRLSALARTCRQTGQRDIQIVDRSAAAAAVIDPDAFDAIVTHLLNNAVEASPADFPVTVNLRPDGATLVIDITDRGCGMPPEFIRDELFRPLSSTKASGHGIGAFQSRELLRKAGGDLLVFSRPGQGTTMRIILPRIRGELTELIEA